jgi:gliding motility-associated-like protein
MRFIRIILICTSFTFSFLISQAQGFTFNCSRDTSLPGCPPNLCFTLKAIIPDIHGLSDNYTLNPMTGYGVPACSPTYVLPNDPGTPTNLSVDDTYSSVINIGFNFPFYGAIYNSLVASTNGVISFDISNANGFAHWNIINGGAPQNMPSAFYDRALIMGPYHDLLPGNPASPTQLIQYTTAGGAPYRKWILSFYKVPLFGGGCNPLIENTHQIILYESTGIIEIKIYDKQICFNWNQGRAMVGIQNWNQDQALMPPGRMATDAPWGSIGMNESWRFVPSAGPSLFRRVELYDITGTTLIATGTTASLPNGSLEASFSNICPPAGVTTSYLVKSFYTKIDDPNVEVFGIDTLRVTRSSAILSTVITTPSGCSANTGSITASNTSGGTPPYEYSLNGTTWQSSNVFNGLASGNYTVSIRDAAALCFASYPVTVGITGVLNASVSSTPTSCPGVNDGTITATPLSGTGPFTYRLNFGPPQVGNVFTNLAPGLYTVLITETSTGCTSGVMQVNVSAGTGITSLAQVNPTTCNGANNGSIIVNPTSGQPPYTYSLNGGPAQGGNVFNNLAPGTYSIVITDAAGCTGTRNETIVAGPFITASTIQTNVQCFGSNNGFITVSNPTPGTAPFQFSLDGTNWQPSPVFNNLAPGNYTVYFQEANGCQNTTNVTITEPSVLVSSVSTTPVVCNGQNDGMINVTAFGGTAPYQYSLDGGVYRSSGLFDTVAAGNHFVIIRDANSCLRTENMVITEPAVLTLSGNTGAASCDGGNDGLIVLNASGGNLSYQYSIDGINFQSSDTFRVAPGTYTVIVRDNLNCTATRNFTVGLASNLTHTPLVDQTICEGSSVQVNFISNAATYNWRPAIGISNPAMPNPVFTPKATQQYIVSYTLGRCTEEDTILVNVNAAPVPNAGPDGFICYGQNFQLHGSGGVVYNWSPGSFLNSTSSANPVVTPDNTITYTLSILSDANNCPSLVTDQVTVDVTPPIKVKTYPQDTIVYAGDTFQLLAVSTAPNYSWSPGFGVDNPAVPNPTVTADRDMILIVTASSQAGCKGEGSVRIRVYNGPDIYVPTGFTPNGDGLNDKFTPFPVGIQQLRYFRIFNRWGQLVFSTTRLNEGWDGTMGGKEQPGGAYAWIAQGVTRDGKVITKKGTIVLIR